MLTNVKKTIGSGVVALLIAGAAAATAHATVEYVGGGTFDYGVNYWSGTVWSDYHHPSKAHTSTACNASDCSWSGVKPAGVWARATISSTLGGNTAYWNAF